MNIKPLKLKENSYMAKRSKRRHPRSGRHQAGCMWGLISLFDFRQGRTPKRLLSDRSRMSKLSEDYGHSNTETTIQGPIEECGNMVDAEDINMPAVDVVRTSVKELMEEEMINDKGSKNESNESEVRLDHVGLKNGRYGKKNQKWKNRICSKSSDMDVSELEANKCLMPEEFDKVPEQKISDNRDLEALMKELANINQSTNCKKHDFHDDAGVPSGQAVTVAEENLIAAIKLFLEQRISHSEHLGEEGKLCCYKELSDALKTLNSDKGVFFKQLKDPNSMLVKCIQNFDDAKIEKHRNSSAFPGYNLSEEKPINLRSDEISCHKNRNFFRRRSRSLEICPGVGEKNDQSSSKIVILKPGPAFVNSSDTDINVSRISLQSYCMDNKENTERNTSQFSFNEIKRKLRHAMGREKQGISPDGLIAKRSSRHQNGKNGDKITTGENFSWSSPNRNHFYTERFAKSSSFKKDEQVGKMKANGPAMVKEPCQYPRVGVSNVYIEAKMHLSEILKNGDENVDSITEQLHKSLGRILALPDYNSSPCCSPRNHDDGIFITASMRLSPNGMVKSNESEIMQESNSNHSNLSRQSSENLPCNSDYDNIQLVGTNMSVRINDDQDYFSVIHPFTGETVDNEGVVETNEMIESRPQEEEKFHYIPSESFSTSVSGDSQIRDTNILDNEENEEKSSTRIFKLDYIEDDQPLPFPTASPTQSPTSREVEASECMPDKIERPSPVSVLEPFFTDYDISPPSPEAHPVEKDIQPLQIHFEGQSSPSDQGICVRISLEDEESAFEYVEAVLLGSGLNWDEFLPRWLSSCVILDSSLFDEVELFSSRTRQDQKLLFDCANESLKEVCGNYYGCFSGISYVKKIIRPVPKGMDLIHQVWELIEGHLTKHQSPCCLEQLVEIDMSKSGKWLNLQSDIEGIGFEMWETIFDELLEDVMLSFVNNTSNQDVLALQPAYESHTNSAPSLPFTAT